MRHEVTTISYIRFYSKVHAYEDAHEKRHFKFRLHGDQIGIFPVFKPLEKILKIGLAI